MINIQKHTLHSIQHELRDIMSCLALSQTPKQLFYIRQRLAMLSGTVELALIDMVEDGTDAHGFAKENIPF